MKWRIRVLWSLVSSSPSSMWMSPSWSSASCSQSLIHCWVRCLWCLVSNDCNPSKCLVLMFYPQQSIRLLCSLTHQLQLTSISI
jgi:hypothetical protein